jgi:hypothetical protein
MPLAQDTTTIHSKLFLHNLLNVVQSSEKYQLRQMQNRDNHLDDRIQQPDNQRSKKASSIFVDGCQTRPESVSSLCSTAGCLIDLIAINLKNPRFTSATKHSTTSSHHPRHQLVEQLHVNV